MQLSDQSDRAQAAEIGVNVKTVAKWRKRETTEDAPMGPKRRSENALNPAQEALVVVLRKMTRASPEKLLIALRRLMPGLSKSRLYRCLCKWEVSRLPRRLRADQFEPADGVPAPMLPPRLRIFLHRFAEDIGRPVYLWTCVNDAGDWVDAWSTESADASTRLSHFTQYLGRH